MVKPAMTVFIIAFLISSFLLSGMLYAATRMLARRPEDSPASAERLATIRELFGLSLVSLGVYMLVAQAGLYPIYVLILFLISAAYIFWKGREHLKFKHRVLLMLTPVACAAVAAMIAGPKQFEAGIVWEAYSEKAVAAAQEDGKGVIIDVFADWCVPCKQLDASTFADPGVAKEAGQFVTLKLDLTERDSELETSLNIRRVPTVIFLDSAGRERTDLRLEGFEKPDLFLSRLRRLYAPSWGKSD